jgi:hypothetical protein
MSSALSRDQYDSPKALSYRLSARLVRQPGHTLTTLLNSQQSTEFFTCMVRQTGPITAFMFAKNSMNRSLSLFFLSGWLVGLSFFVCVVGTSANANCLAKYLNGVLMAVFFDKLIHTSQVGWPKMMSAFFKISRSISTRLSWFLSCWISSGDVFFGWPNCFFCSCFHRCINFLLTFNERATATGMATNATTCGALAIRVEPDAVAMAEAIAWTVSMPISKTV